MSALERARDAVVACEGSLVGVFGAGEHAQARTALNALLDVVEEQEARLDRIEDRIGETLGMGG